MPQGKKLGDKRAMGVPEKQAYARKPDQERAAPVIAAKSERAATSQNRNFKAALPTMIRNAEMLAAGKLVQEGRVLL
jgi:hypothetical protein